MQAVSTCLFEYATFNGRADRSEFWYFMLAVALAVAAGVFVDSHFVGHPLVVWIVAILTLTPSLAVGCRRLHDTERSGWWQLLLLFPVFGAFMLLVSYLMPTFNFATRYGPPPGTTRR